MVPHGGASKTPGARVSGAKFGASGSTLLDLHALSPCVINTGHNGELSPAGEFHTTYQDLEELANHLLLAKRVEWNIPPGHPLTWRSTCTAGSWTNKVRASSRRNG
jgi:hypothetical protein